jgi:hypothetical protein
MMVRFLAALLIAAAAIGSAAAKEKAPAPPAPALWKISDADSEIYLFAAAPFLPAGEAWRSRAVAAAIDRSQSIVFEAPSADPAARAAAGKIFESAGQFRGGKTLSAALGEDGAAGLASVAAALGAETAQFDALKPWAAFVVLSAELDRKRGADPAAGVEMGVLKEAIGRQRPVRFLDSVEGALSVLTEMPESDQRALLSFLLADWPRQDEAAAAALAAWRAGDVDAVAVEAQEPLKEAAPGAYDRLIAARAAFLADRIAALLELPEEAFVCLSASVVVGADGVAARLEERGFAVERIDALP